MICEFIACFIGIWTAFAFSSYAAFQYAQVIQIRWRQNKIQFSGFAQIRRFTAETCEFYLVGLKLPQHGIERVKIPRRVWRNVTVASMDGCHVMIKCRILSGMLVL